MHPNDKSFRLSDISPQCLWRTVLHHLWMVVLAALIFMMGTSLYLSLFRKPVYAASMTYAVTSRRTSYFASANLTATKEVAAVLADLLESDVVVEKVRAHSDDLRNFDGSISARQIPESNFIQVTSNAGTPKQAYLAILAVSELFPDLSDYISSSSVVQTIRNPIGSPAPINSVNETRYCIVAGLAGAALMVVLLCWLSISQETVQTRSGANHMLDAKIIGTISHEKRSRAMKKVAKKTGKSKQIQIFSPTTGFNYVEQIQSVAAQLVHENVSHGSKVFMVTGVGESEGKSTVAANLAAALAMQKKNVALLDGDLRKPAINKFFDNAYKAKTPLNKLLAMPFSKENLMDCIRRYEPLQTLYMLFPLSTDDRCTELLSGSTMKELLRKLHPMDFIIIDTPPMGMFPDAEALAELVDASLLVVRQDYTPAPDINDAIDALRHTGSDFLGCVLNDMRGGTHGGGSGSYGYGYGYGYGLRSKFAYGKSYGYGYGYGNNGYGYGSKSKDGYGKSKKSKDGYGKAYGYGYGYGKSRAEALASIPETGPDPDLAEFDMPASADPDLPDEEA